MYFISCVEMLQKIVFLFLVTELITLGNSEKLIGKDSTENAKPIYCSNPAVRRMLLLPEDEIKGSVDVILKQNYSSMTSGVLFCNDDEDLLYSYRYQPRTYKHNIEGSLIRVGAILGFEHDANYTIENGSLRFTGGLYYECLRYLTDSFNISFLSVDGIEYAATRPKNGSDVGRMILNGEVDLCISVHEYTTYRASRFSFLQPTYIEKLWGYFIQPPASSIRDIYLQAFEMEIWITMALTWIIVILSVTFVSCLKRYTSDLHYNEETILEEVVIWAIGCICQFGSHLHPESASLKIVFFCGLATGLVTYLGYSAALVSVLSLDVVPLKIFADMISAKFQFYGSDAIPNVQYYLEKVKEDDPHLVNTRSLTNTNGEIEEILHGGSVFLSFDDEFFPVIKSSFGLSDAFICSKISKIVVNHTPIKASMLVKKNSPLTENFNRRLIWMFNNGILNRLRRHHVKMTMISCPRNSQHRNAALGINDIFTAIAILLVIYAVSLLYLVIEKLFPPRT